MKNRGKGLIMIGLLLIAAALFLTGYNIHEQKQAGDAAKQAVLQMRAELPEPMLAGMQQSLNQEMPVVSVDGRAYIGLLTIPTLNRELPVISEWDYESLKYGPCRYAGSAYQDDLVICAHNYWSHFGNFRSLSIGDEVIFTDVEGQVYRYQIAEVEVLESMAVEEMKSGEWDLTLFTCTLGGQSRMTVRCERI